MLRSLAIGGGSGSELATCTVYVEKGHKVIGVMGEHNFELKSHTDGSVVSSNNGDATDSTEFKEENTNFGIAEDPVARRYDISFHANTTSNVEAIEFVKCKVMGQSFMLHQIQKMTGLVMAFMTNLLCF